MASISCWTPASVERSASTVRTLEPTSDSASSNGVSAARMRSKPSVAASLAISRPMPLEAPVTTASSRCDTVGLPSGLEHDLGVSVLLVVELLVAARAVLERHAVADQEGRIDLALGDRGVE